jgi:hypothetical protein
MGRHDRILALLIKGEPGDSFPAALREIRRRIPDEKGLDRETIEEIEPLAADVRSSRCEPRSHLTRMAKLRLLACVLGCRFDDLRQREQERPTRRVMYVGVAAIALVCVMTAITAFALVQRRAAILNADRASKGEAAAKQNAAIAEQNARQAGVRLAAPSRIPMTSVSVGAHLVPTPTRHAEALILV